MTDAQWQTKLGEPGVRVTGLDELEQSLTTIIDTPLGSVPGRPKFGSRLFELVDEPVTVVRGRAPGMVRLAVQENDPRIEVLETTIVDVAAAAAGGVTAQIVWQPAGQPNVRKTTEVTVG